jgi:hypothetical protein
MQTITDDELDEQFEFIKNHLDPNASLDGVMFETFGKELEYVLKQPINHVWTYQDDDNGDPCIVNGFHMVNRIGYLVSTTPWIDDYYVKIS